jgi:hypothetical protein|tara:strand:- start:220 stop:399 length:180 start_codon:yes stop_codon:yes gene_type:complete
MVKKWAVKNTNTNTLVSKGIRTKNEAEETLDYYSRLYYAIYSERHVDYKKLYKIVSSSE